MSLLSVSQLKVSYGKNIIIPALDLKLHSGEITVIMGPNGAGKSTLLKSLFGLTPAKYKHYFFDGKKSNPNPKKLNKAGVSFVPQNNPIFPEMTVLENLQLGLLFTPSSIHSQRLKSALEFFPKLKKFKYQRADSLSGGQRQMLALARALLKNPKLLLLDEPSIGLAPQVVEKVFETLKQINTQLGTSIVVVEHNLRSLLPIAHRGVILVNGKIIADDSISVIEKSGLIDTVLFGK